MQGDAPHQSNQAVDGSLAWSVVASEKLHHPQCCGEKTRTSPMEFKYLLMWLLFGFVKRNKPEECPTLPMIEFADVTADTYALETKLYYECDNGYKRSKGQYPGIQCQSIDQVASWVYQKFECIAMLNFTQKAERKPQSPAPQKQENLPEFDRKGFCGPPKTIPHASLSLEKEYHVGQVLYFRCQNGYTKRSPTSGTSTCKKENGKIIWTPLDMRCTNGSGKWPPQALEKVIFVVLLIIPAVFV